MRIKKLKLYAFGPFKNEEVIDFEENGFDEGLVLITGQTGSGKTTLFDAITFALYGRTSGMTRGDTSMQSAYADPKTKGYVELDFRYKGKDYFIHRDIKGRGGKFEHHGVLYTKSNEMSEAIKSILGMDYDQFSKIVMLAQGEFTKFLDAKNEEKTFIFRNIFQTKKYADITDALEKEYRKHLDDFNTYKTLVDAKIANIHAVETIGKTSKEILSSLATLIKEKQDEANKLAKEKERLEKEKDKKERSIGLIKEMNENILSFQKAKEALEKLKVDYPNIEKEKNIYQYNIEVVQQVKPKKEILLKNEEEIEKKKEFIKVSAKQKIEIDHTLKEKKDEYLLLDTYTEDVLALRDGQTKLKEERKNYILQQQQIEKKCQLKEEIKSLLDRLAKENDKLRGVEEAYYTHGAYVIASRLKKGDTCPVCGNTFNGLGASLKEIKVTKEDVEQQRQIQKNAEKKKDACVHNLDNLQEQIDALGIKEDALFQEEIANRTNKIKELEEKEKALEKKYIRLKKEKETLTRTFDQLVEQASLAEKRIEELKEENNRLEEEIKNIYKDNASSEKEYEEKRIDTLVFRQFKQQIEQYDALYIKNKATIEHLEEKVKGKEIVDIAKEEEELKEKREKLKELTTQYNGYLTDIQMHQQNHDELAQYSKHYDEAEVRMNRYKNLYNVAAGKTTKTHHDSLENYVQSLKIDYLLDIANRKLKKMSNEQFTFIKQEDNGIGLDVFDYYSNSPRKIGDISGGEKFKAALSLALSLTEMISSSASGVKMDSLFIDEGFGRLDPDSLHSAIQILTELADSDKMIGIISHVEELKNSIDHKINIHKSTTGSTIEI